MAGLVVGGVAPTVGAGVVAAVPGAVVIGGVVVGGDVGVVGGAGAVGAARTVEHAQTSCMRGCICWQA